MQLLLQPRDREAWVEALRTRFAAVHNGVAAIDLEGVIQLLQPLCARRVREKARKRTTSKPEEKKRKKEEAEAHIMREERAGGEPAVSSSRVSATQRKACISTAGPKYFSEFHQ